MVMMPAAGLLDHAARNRPTNEDQQKQPKNCAHRFLLISWIGVVAVSAFFPALAVPPLAARFPAFMSSPLVLLAPWPTIFTAPVDPLDGSLTIVRTGRLRGGSNGCGTEQHQTQHDIAHVIPPFSYKDWMQIGRMLGAMVSVLGQCMIWGLLTLLLYRR
jgi:hypothetical protein